MNLLRVKHFKNCDRIWFRCPYCGMYGSGTTTLNDGEDLFYRIATTHDRHCIQIGASEKDIAS